MVQTRRYGPAGRRPIQGPMLRLARVIAPVLVTAALGPRPFAQAVAAHGKGPAPLTTAPREAWSFGPLQVEGPPIVVPDGVLVPAREVSGRRIVAWFTLDGGRLLSRTVFPGTEPLGLARSGARLAVRSGGGRVDVLRLASGRLTSERTFLGDAPASAPVLEDEQLFARFGDTLVAWSTAQREPVWRSEDRVWRGEPAAHPLGLLALAHGKTNQPVLVCLDRATGAVRAEVALGASDDTLPGRDATCEWAVHENLVFVRPPRPLRSTSGEAFPWACVAVTAGGLAAEVRLFDLAAAPVEVPGLSDGWVAPEVLRQGAPGTPAPVRWLLAREGGGRTLELASDAHHTWLSHVAAPAARNGSVLHLGASAVALPDLEVLWREPVQDLRFAPVPVENGLLLVDGDRLRLLAVPPPPISPGERRAGDVVADLDRRHGERLGLLAAKLARAGDRDGATALLDEAEALGAAGRAVTRARADVERVAGAASGPDPRLLPAVQRELGALRARRPRDLAEAVRGASDPATARALLQALGRRCPGSDELGELLRAALPASARVTAENRLSWIDFLARRDALGLELVDPAGPEDRTEGAQRVLQEREAWRPDVVGFRSPGLVVVATQDDPGAVARVLEAGELVLRILGTVLGSRPEGARGAPLEIVLYPTREEYLAHSSGELGGLEAVLSWTAGHFDATAGVSRFFLPEDDRRRARLVGVAAHELTHHWLSRQSPFGPTRATRATPGYWAAEAIASWTEELTLDPARGTWSIDNPRAASLDTVACTPPGELLSWARLLSFTAADAQGLETGATSRTTLAWQLGRFAERSPLQLFYAQGAALAHYLYRVEGGRHRALLVQAVRAHHEGRPFDLLGELGLAAPELGDRVQAFARRSVDLPDR